MFSGNVKSLVGENSESAAENHRRSAEQDLLSLNLSALDISNHSRLPQFCCEKGRVRIPVSDHWLDSTAYKVIRADTMIYPHAEQPLLYISHMEINL